MVALINYIAVTLTVPATIVLIILVLYVTTQEMSMVYVNLSKIMLNIVNVTLLMEDAVNVIVISN